MEKCPKCNFKKVLKVVTRDPETELVVETASVCKNCKHVLRRKVYDGSKE